MAAHVSKAARSRLKKAENTGARAVRILPNVAAVQSFTKDDTRHYVLIGAALSVDSRASGAVPQRVQVTLPLSGEKINIYTSSRSTITSPYRVAVACTCPDWLIRGGLEFAPGECPELSSIAEGNGDILAAEKSQEFRDAGQGCKHMMLCNSQLLYVQPITLGPSRRNAFQLDTFWNSKAIRKSSAPYQVTGSRVGHCTDCTNAVDEIDEAPF